jgi:hypothetical protein
MNTTLHHEQAVLNMLLLGGWLSLSQDSRTVSWALAGTRSG